MVKAEQLVIVTILVLLILFCTLSRAEETGEDYLDYEEQNELEKKLQIKLDEKKIIALNRDWLARREPNRYPTAGFFSPWVATLLIISSTFAVVVIISGMLHLFGCGGKRPIVLDVSRRSSLASMKDAAAKKPLVSTAE